MPYSLLVQILFHPSLRLGSHSFIMPYPILVIALVVDNLQVPSLKPRAFGGEDSLSPIINARGVSLLNCAIFYTRQSESNLRSSVNTRGTNKIVQLLFHLRYHTAVTFSRPVARCARIFSSMSTSHIVLL